MPDFIVNFGRSANGAPDLAPKQITKFIAQTSSRNARHNLAHIQPCRSRAIVSPSHIAGDKWLKDFKKLDLAGGAVPLPQLVQHILEENRRPFPLKNICRILGIGWFKTQTGFGFADIDRKSGA